MVKKILQSTRIVRLTSGLQLARVSCGLTRAKLAAHLGLEARDVRKLENQGADYRGWTAKLMTIAQGLTHLPARASLAMSQDEYARHIGSDRPFVSVAEALEHAYVAEALGREVPASTRRRIAKKRQGESFPVTLSSSAAKFVRIQGGSHWIASLIAKEMKK